MWIQTELSELDQMNLKELNYCNLYKSNPRQIILILMIKRFQITCRENIDFAKTAFQQSAQLYMLANRLHFIPVQRRMQQGLLL